jgi:hypothetical protein
MVANNIEEAKKYRRLAMFCSAPGLGKTYIMTRTAKREGVKFSSGEGISPSNKTAVAYAFWRERQAGNGLTIFDDHDLPMRSESMISVLKPAWSAPGEGIVRTPETHAIRRNEKFRQAFDDRYDPMIPPLSFPFTLGHLWSLNKAVHTKAGRAVHKCHSDFEALVDRGLNPIWINSNPRNVCFYTVWMIVEGNLFRELGLSVAEQVETFDFFCDIAVTHPHPNLRLALELARARRKPDFARAWAAIIRASLDAARDEPKALTEDDLKGAARPDLAAEIAKARARTPPTVIVPPPPLIVPPTAGPGRQDGFELVDHRHQHDGIFLLVHIEPTGPDIKPCLHHLTISTHLIHHVMGNIRCPTMAAVDCIERGPAIFQVRDRRTRQLIQH